MDCWDTSLRIEKISVIMVRKINNQWTLKYQYTYGSTDKTKINSKK